MSSLVKPLKCAHTEVWGGMEKKNSGFTSATWTPKGERPLFCPIGRTDVRPLGHAVRRHGGGRDKEGDGEGRGRGRGSTITVRGTGPPVSTALVQATGRVKPNRGRTRKK